jgi:hypothetical protein
MLSTFNVPHSNPKKSLMPMVFETSAPFQDFLGDVCSLGIVPGGDQATEYGVIFARSNQRYWLIPLHPKTAALAGFALFHPVTWRASVAKATAVLAVRVGLTPLWARTRICLDVSSMTKGYFDVPVSHLAFFTGTDGPHRKTAIEFIGLDGKILGYAKVTRQPHIAPYIQNESIILRRLETLCIESADVPKCLSFDDDGIRTLIVTDTLKSRLSVSPTTMTAAHFAFLHEIARKTRREADCVTRDDLIAQLRNASTGSPAGWQTRFETGIRLLQRADIELSVALTHGDFTPWNCFMQAGRLYVFDWEYSEASLPLGYDVMKFLTCQMASIGQKNVGDLVILEVARLYFDGNTRQAQTHYHLALLRHSAFYIQRAKSQGDGIELWPEHVQFATLIDFEVSRVDRFGAQE